MTFPFGQDWSYSPIARTVMVLEQLSSLLENAQGRCHRKTFVTAWFSKTMLFGAKVSEN